MSGQTAHSSKPLIFLLIIFIVPFLSASLLFKQRNKLNIPVQSTGHILERPIPLSTLKLEELQRIPQTSSGKPSWQLIFAKGSDCHGACQARLDILPNIRLALGKETERLMLRIVKAQEDSVFKANQTLLVSPSGQVALSYDLAAPPKGILSDLRRLMKYSYEG